MKPLIVTMLLLLALVACHKKPIKSFTEPLTFSETIPGKCIAGFEDTSFIYCRVSQGSGVATCYLMRPIKKGTPECQTKYIFPD
jgi:hypothetical protein